LKETTRSNLSIPRPLKSVIRSRAASRNQFAYEYLSELVLREVEQAQSEQSATSPMGTEQPHQPMSNSSNARHPIETLADR